MDLVAGDARDVVLALVGRRRRRRSPTRTGSPPTSPLGGGLDPTWLDLFSEAVRSVTGGDEPVDFLDARTELDGPDGDDRADRRAGRRRLDRRRRRGPGRARSGALAGRWIELLEEELGLLPREEKPWIRDLAGADRRRSAGPSTGARDVVFAWGF